MHSLTRLSRMGVGYLGGFELKIRSKCVGGEKGCIYGG